MPSSIYTSQVSFVCLSSDGELSLDIPFHKQLNQPLVFAFNIGFYALPFGEKHGYNVSFPILGMINGLTIIPLVFLWFYGQSIREKQGTPKIHEDL